MTPAEKEELYKEFKSVVNMTAAEIDKFLNTEESKKVGQKKEGEDESIGHASGRHIIKILKKPKSTITDDDYAHMKKVISYVRRHLAQGGPDEDKEHSKWRYSLMNWGNDPLKK